MIPQPPQLAGCRLPEHARSGRGATRGFLPDLGNALRFAFFTHGKKQAHRAGRFAIADDANVCCWWPIEKRHLLTGELDTLCPRFSALLASGGDNKLLAWLGGRQEGLTVALLPESLAHKCAIARLRRHRVVNFHEWTSGDPPALVDGLVIASDERLALLASDEVVVLDEPGVAFSNHFVIPRGGSRTL